MPRRIVGNEIRYTPDQGFSGDATIRYRMIDSEGVPSEANLVVTVGQPRPPVAQNDEFEIGETSTLAGSVFTDNNNGVDQDPDGDVFTVTEVNGIAANVGTPIPLMSGATATIFADGAISVQTNGAYNYLALGEEVVETLTYTIDDAIIGSDTATVTLRFIGENDAPNLPAILRQIDEDTSVTVDLLSGATDADTSDMLSVSNVNGHRNGNIVINNGILTYTPDSNYNGTEVLNYSVTDGTTVVTSTLTIIVDPVNDAPTGGADTALTPAGVPVVIDALSNDSDMEGDAIFIASINQPASGGTAQITPQGQILFTSDSTEGDFTFSYQLSDGDIEVPVSVTVTVTPAVPNRAPIAANERYTVNEDGTLVVNAATGVLANDSDPDFDTLQLVLTRDVTNGTLTLNADGSFSYVPFADFNGQDSFVYAIIDPDGFNDSATARISVLRQNDAPDAENDAFDVFESGAAQRQCDH